MSPEREGAPPKWGSRRHLIATTVATTGET